MFFLICEGIVIFPVIHSLDIGIPPIILTSSSKFSFLSAFNSIFDPDLDFLAKPIMFFLR